MVRDRERTVANAIAWRDALRRSRRRLILVAAAGFMVAPMLRAQPQRKPARIGLLSYLDRTEAESLQGLQPFLSGMRERGYLLGEHFVLDIRVSGGDARRMPALADELIGLGPDILLGVETPAVALAAKTSTIPIVLYGSVDPVAAGLVKSLARPGTNVTGMAGQGHDLVAKHVELLHELVPNASRITVLLDPFWTAREDFERAALRAAAVKGLTLSIVYVKDAREVKQAFAEFEKRRPDGLIATGSGTTVTLQGTIRDEVLRLRLPMIGLTGPGGRVGSGGAVGYGPDGNARMHEAADFVDRILKGAKPADLPMRQSTRFFLTVDMKTARAVGLKVPQSILLRADEVIE